MRLNVERLSHGRTSEGEREGGGKGTVDILFINRYTAFFRQRTFSIGWKMN
jgi:hypothetical protein